MDTFSALFRALLVAVLAFAGFSTAALAQRAKETATIATFWATTQEVAAPFISAFELGLAERGWVTGRNLRLHHRFTDGRPERLAPLAADIVALQPDVIMTGVNNGAVAVRAVTKTIPIVVGASLDPIGIGLVQSLARPGGNVTGVVGSPPEVAAKRLQFLIDTMPGVRRIGLIYTADAPGSGSSADAIKRSAVELDMTVSDAALQKPEDIDAAFARLTAAGVEAVVGVGDNLTFLNRHKIAELALRHRLPTSFNNREFCTVGVLLCYAPELSAMFRRTADFADRILRGASPAELPMEYPTAFTFAVNLKTARELKLTIPESVIVRADVLID